MLFLLSPAKSLDYDTPLPAAAQGLPMTQPVFTRQPKALVERLRECTPVQVAQLMSLSDKLAALNVARYAAWRPRHTGANARSAIFAFNGDVYEGFDAQTLDTRALQWAQDHVAILSGLYGVLRPLDAMQPYRLEMGTALDTSAGHNLYQFWGRQIADHLNERLATHDQPIIVNLASQEYFKSVDRKVLQARVIDCVFEDEKGGQYKVISFLAKRARGLMARYAAQHQLKKPAQLEKFALEGYAFDPKVSEPDRLVFRRKQT